jgi:aspartate/methionine/tyrosine aminotransferase
MSELIFPRVQKLPKYVFAMVNELKMKLRREGEDIVDLGMGNPDLPPAPHIIEKALRGGKEGQCAWLFFLKGYTKAQEGYMRLLQKKLRGGN